MKKSLIVILSALLLFSFAACGAKQPASSSEASSSAVEISSSEVSSEASSEAQPDAVGEGVAENERLVVADASLYRGTIQDFAVSDDGKTVLMLKQADGTDFGFSTLNVAIDDSTKYNFDSKEMGNGAYIEVYYSGKNADESVNAIAINSLMSEDAMLYNGILVEVTPDPEKEGFGSILLDPIGEGMGYMFHYSDETQFYVDIATLKAGDKLNVLHSPMATRSIPPQSPAFEVRLYAEAK